MQNYVEIQWNISVYIEMCRTIAVDPYNIRVYDENITHEVEQRENTSKNSALY